MWIVCSGGLASCGFPRGELFQQYYAKSILSSSSLQSMIAFPSTSAMAFASSLRRGTRLRSRRESRTSRKGHPLGKTLDQGRRRRKPKLFTWSTLRNMPPWPQRKRWLRTSLKKTLELRTPTGFISAKFGNTILHLFSKYLIRVVRLNIQVQY